MTPTRYFNPRFACELGPKGAILIPYTFYDLRDAVKQRGGASSEAEIERMYKRFIADRKRVSP